MNPTRVASLAGVAAFVAVTVGVGVGAPEAAHAQNGSSGIQKIKHVVVIMQENRSFDSYFGTYPKADGIPTKGGKPSPCVPNSKTGKCDKPFVDHADVNGGGPHSQNNATADLNGGKMDGFVRTVVNAKANCSVSRARVVARSGSSKSPTAARCSWTRSRTCRSRPKARSCAS